MIYILYISQRLECSVHNSHKAKERQTSRKMVEKKKFKWQQEKTQMTIKMTVYFKSLRKHKPNQGDITSLNGYS